VQVYGLEQREVGVEYEYLTEGYGSSSSCYQIDQWQHFHAELIELSDGLIVDFGLTPSAIYGPLPDRNGAGNNGISGGVNDKNNDYYEDEEEEEEEEEDNDMGNNNNNVDGGNVNDRDGGRIWALPRLSDLSPLGKRRQRRRMISDK
jgi:hypothetical protein